MSRRNPVCAVPSPEPGRNTLAEPPFSRHDPKTPKAPGQDQTSDAVADVSKTTVSTPKPADGERASKAGSPGRPDGKLNKNLCVHGDGTAGDGTPPQGLDA